MEKYTGVLRKMSTTFGSPIQYELMMNDERLLINSLLEKNLAIHFTGEQCLHCLKEKKLFRQGHCYDCFYKSPSTADWIMKPELSKAHLNIKERDLEYEKKMQLQPHLVYLALSSHVKVGITRKQQTPTRWIDQGAYKALPILETPNRYLAGVAEVALRQYVSDKTSWQKMLKNEIIEENLLFKRDELLQFVPEECKPYCLNNSYDILELNYPVLRYPKKVKSLNLTKSPFFEGRLIGIKGQYLMFDDGTVFNIRSNEGKIIELSITS